MRTPAAVLCAVVLALSACGGGTFDEEGLDAAESYVDEQVSALNAAVAAGPDGLTEEHVSEVTEVRDAYWADAPEAGEVEGWSWNASQGGETWEMDGAELADVLWELEAVATRVESTWEDPDREPMADALADAEDVVGMAEAYFEPR